MKRKIKYILLITLFLLEFGLSINEIKAATYSDTIIERWQNLDDYVFYRHYTTPSLAKSHRMSIIARASDKKFVYCIQPGMQINGSAIYSGYDTNQIDYTNMSPQQWERVQLLAYYGYGYGNHTAAKWYSVTQFMIWNSVPKEYEIYYSKDLGNNKIEKYTNEMAELENLLMQHKKSISFSGKKFSFIKGETKTIHDNNNILNTYAVSTCNNCDAKIVNNDLIITAKESGNINITLVKKSNNYNNAPIVYTNPNSQDVYMVGKPDPRYASISGEVVLGELELKKYDKDNKSCKPQEGGSLKGSIYKLYNSNGTFLQDLIIDDNCSAKATGLSYGNYYIQESKAGINYELDNKKYDFVISENSVKIQLVVYDKMYLGQVAIEKKDMITNQCKSSGNASLSGAVYGVYKNDGTLVTKLITNGECYAESSKNLLLGKYYIQEILAPKGYELDNKKYFFEITKENADSKVSFSLQDKLYSAKLEVQKKDENGKVIPIKGIKFKIYDIDRKKYICQNAFDFSDEEMCIFETNEQGNFITSKELFYGNYRLEELDQKINGYLWNKNSIEFSIDENTPTEVTKDLGKVFKLDFVNKSVKGKVEIHKKAEKTIVENNSYQYEEINLPNVKFGLYNLEGKLIQEVITNEYGKAVLENLELGKYILKELSVDDSFVLDSKEYEIEIVYQDQYTEVVNVNFEIKNYLKKGNVELTKKDVSTGEVLPNTKINFYTIDDILIYEGITDNNGNIVLQNIPIGKYYFLETEAPNGYFLNDEKHYFEILENNQIIKSELSNEKIEIEVPNTDIADSFVIEVIGTIFIFSGIGVIFYAKKKKATTQKKK